MLKSDEVCALIKACGESGVSSLKWGNLQVSFERSPKEPETPPAIPDTEISEEIAQSGTRRLEQEEFNTKEDELATMLIENPLEYERMLTNRELESKDSGNVDGGQSTE